jgi:hypothetical protein
MEGDDEMKYRLLKDKINSLSWYVNYEKADNVIECTGFSEEMLTYGRTQDIDVLPDIVEEYTPTGIILFEDWDEEIIKPTSGDFFFAHDKRARRMPGGIWGVTEKQHFVRISRRCVEPIGELK